MKNLKIDNDTLLNVYKMEIRSLLEFACPVWNGPLAREEVLQIEKVQKSFLKILSEATSINYSQVCPNVK